MVSYLVDISPESLFFFSVFSNVTAIEKEFTRCSLCVLQVRVVLGRARTSCSGAMAQHLARYALPWKRYLIRTTSGAAILN
jgi:hypothetical protein